MSWSRTAAGFESIAHTSLANIGATSLTANYRTPLSKLIELYPEQHDPEGAYFMLARVQRELGETDAELATLTKLATLSADATEAVGVSATA